MKRRSFIRLVGGAGIVAAAGTGLYGYAATRVFPVPASAIAAWHEAGQTADPRRFALSYAILAPNPHNMQPWMADLTTAGEIAVRLDETRLLPETDPYGRQILMGLGTFLEFLAMAASTLGATADIALFPDGAPGERLDGRRMAVIALRETPGKAADPLFAAITARRTDRRAYDPGRPVSQAEIAALTAAMAGGDVRFGVETGAKVEPIREIARAAWSSEMTTEGAMMESVRVLRVGTREIEAHRDGIVIDDPMLVLLERVGLFDRSTMPAPTSAAVTAQIAEFDRITAATPAYLWMVTEGNARHQQVAAGRAYARVALAGTGLGLSMHPIQQALQEYPEVAEPRRAIHALLDAPMPRFTVQMLARLGHGAAGSGPLPPAPRRGLEAHLT